MSLNSLIKQSRLNSLTACNLSDEAYYEQVVEYLTELKEVRARDNQLRKQKRRRDANREFSNVVVDKRKAVGLNLFK